MRYATVKYGVGLNHLPSGRFAANGAWLAVIQQAYVEGVSTRRVDDLVKAWGVRVSPRARCRASVRNWTWWWMASWAVRWALDPTPTCGWTH